MTGRYLEDYTVGQTFESGRTRIDSAQITAGDHNLSIRGFNGPLSNMPEFHEAFGCATGTPMWREEALRPAIW